MAQTNLCRLCVDICRDGKSLYDENGLGNELYKITCKYFHPTIVNMEEAQHLAAICLSCWQHICDFHRFQSSVLMAQCQLNERKPELLIGKRDEFQETSADACNENCIVKKEPEENPLDVNEAARYSSANVVTDDVMENPQMHFVQPKLEIVDGDFESEYSSDADAGDDADADVKSWTQGQATSPSDRGETPKKKYQRLEDLLAKWIPNIKCVACSESYNKLSALENHFEHQHPNEEFYINCCSRKLSKRFHMKEHLLLHNDPDSFRCARCKKSYASKKGLRRHTALRHPEMETIKFVCKICGKGLRTKWGLKSHYSLIHNTEMPAEEVNSGSQARDRRPFPFDDSSRNQENEAVNNEGFEIPVVKLEQEFTIPPELNNEERFEIPQIKLEKEFTLQPELNDVESFESTQIKLEKEFTTTQSEMATRGYADVVGSTISEADGNALKPPLAVEKGGHQLMHITAPKLEIMDVGSDSELSSDDDEEPMETMTHEESSPQALNRKRQYLRFDGLLAKWMPTVKCVNCPEAYANLTSLQEHFADQHPNEEFYILCCNRKLRHRLQIKDHLLLHNDPDSFKCEQCIKSYATNKGLKRHMGRRHPETLCIKFVCKVCGIGLKTKGGLKLHHITMHRNEELPEEVIQLNECLKAKQARRLLRAERNKLKLQNQKKQATNVTSVVRITENPPENIIPADEDHQKVEAEISPRPQPTTSLKHKTHTLAAKLQQQIEHHNGSPDYTCQACGQISKTETAFYDHMWFIHRVNLKRVCTTCNRSFKRTRDLLEHMASHQKRDIYACAFCSMTFRKIHSVIAHRRKMHPQQSNKNFYRKIDLKVMRRE